MKTCAHCGTHVKTADCTCPHCGTRASCRSTRVPVVALLGLALAGCGNDEPSDTDLDVGDMQPMYGDVPVTDQDGDGYEAGVDCNDDDPSIHPDAEETAGDGVDSNCDENDDT